MFCPICETEQKEFQPFGNPPRKNARCGICGALERHRYLWTLMLFQKGFLDGKQKRILDFGPNVAVEKKLKSFNYLEYITADLERPSAMVKVDITDIQFPDNSFDIVICNHVLEHVPDDNKGISEIRRILKPGGWSIIGIPVTTDKTIEDLSITSPEERRRLYGYADHVRRYGPDVIERIEKNGFQAEMVKPIDILPETFLKLMNIGPGYKGVFICR